jgi:hypothetical protein
MITLEWIAILQTRAAASRFCHDSRGAVSTDFVMLTAGIVLLGVLVVSQIAPGITETGVEIKCKVAGSLVECADR